MKDQLSTNIQHDINKKTKGIKKIIPMIHKKKTIPVTLIKKQTRNTNLWTTVKKNIMKNGEISLWSEEMYKAMIQARDTEIQEK